MIPVSLTLKGIYSYQDKEQTIDFTKLSSSGLFGIFGAVGSGKSTILEAISFALYGETERLNSRDKRGYNMMNLKSDKLLIDFTFLNASDKTKYRFIAKANRNKKRFEDVNTIERMALKLSNGEWEPIAIKSAEEISGLSYINFRRTVIIPQGQFQEFLQLGDTDRSKMMKELFHLERFDLYGKTRVLEEKNNSTIEHLNGQLEQLVEISNERILEISKELLETKEVLKSVHKNQETLSTEIEVQKQLKSISNKILEEEKVLQNLDKQRPHIEQLKNDLKEFNLCKVLFSGQITKLNDLKQRQLIYTNLIKDLTSEFESLEKKLKQIEPIFENLKIRFNNKEELNAKAENCRKILQLSILDGEIIKLKERLEKGDVEILKTSTKIEMLTNEKTSVKNSIQEIKLNQKDLTKLSKIKTWYTQLESIQNEITGTEKELSVIKQSVDNYTIAFSQIAEKLEMDPKYLKNVNLNEKINNSIHVIEAEIETCELELKHLKIKQGLLSYSEQLNAGEACPVCGSTHHPDKMKPADLIDKLNKQEKQFNELKLELKKLQEVEKEFNKKNTEFNLTNQNLIATALKLEKSNQKLKSHKESYKFDIEISEDDLDKSFADAENQKKQIEKSEAELVKTENLLELENKNKEKYQKALNDLNILLAEKSANYNTISGQVSREFLNEYSELSVSQLENKITEIDQEYKKLEKDYHSAEKEIIVLRPELDKLFVLIESKKNDLSQIVAEIEEQSTRLDAEIEQKSFKSLADVQAILNKQINEEKENNKISDFENQFFGASSQLIKLKQELNERVFDVDNFNQKLAEYDKNSKDLNELHQKLGSLEKDKKEQEQKLHEKKNLNNEFEKRSERGDNINTLLKIFKGSGFVNYISSVYLQNLVNAANKRFQLLTGQKLRLELTSTNDFLIRDYLNEGKLRSVKTLSGGQTFQASLSLALALADSIQSINKSEDNFFFLDEGFGSLDKNSLATVFDSLKSLRHENRIVGIISHVEELQQEIDNYLKIENSADEGSLISASWE